jgi:hypothetical protein
LGPSPKADDCSGWRKKALCCTPSPDLDEFICDKSLCDIIPGYCPPDGYECDLQDDPDDDNWETWPPAQRTLDELIIRNVSLVASTGLEPRAPAKNDRRPLIVDLIMGLVLQLFARRYPGPTHLYDGRNGQQANQNAYR